MMNGITAAKRIRLDSPCSRIVFVGILQRYSKAIDEYRRDAIRKLEQMRETYKQRSTTDSNAH
jgi:hypothetical protein